MGQKLAVHCANHANQRLILNRPIIDEKILVHAGAARKRRQAGPSSDKDLVSLVAHGQAVFRELRSHDLGHTPEGDGLGVDQVGGCGCLAIDQRPLATDQRKSYVRPRQGKAADHVTDRRDFCAVGFEEL